MDKHTLSAQDIFSKFIAPALYRAGWDPKLQFSEQISFTKGRILRGKLATRGRMKRAAFMLKYKPGVAIAVIEARRNSYSVGDGVQQTPNYTQTLTIALARPAARYNRLRASGDCSTCANQFKHQPDSGRGWVEVKWQVIANPIKELSTNDGNSIISANSCCKLRRRASCKAPRWQKASPQEYRHKQMIYRAGSKIEKRQA